MSENKHTNSLINASSPYLLQHAHNPVNWEEWNASTWERARAEDKLVLVSIGYSACHWCHVMEHHCFEDEKLAAIMNENFISIKVDREERPDVDMVYMDACQAMTGRGGWPLNVFCLPDGRPIYAGTYFPPESWQKILEQLSGLYSTDKDKTHEYAGQLMQAILEMNKTPAAGTEKFTRASLFEMYGRLSEGFDLENGGRKGAPKFPMPNNLELVLDHFLLTRYKESSDFLHLSLMKMANGGIYDHLRGGFCRYSVDGQWFAPHFEKMLYDNAQMISLYARAFGVFDAPLYKTVAEECITFCMRELQEAPGTGFYSALDADSEGVEGKFYVFTDADLKQALSENEYALACLVFGCTATGNWEHDYNILHRELAPLQVLEMTKLGVDEYSKTLLSIRTKLYALQETRIRPGLDNKIIACWNGLMLKALSHAALYLAESKYLDEATQLGNWIWDNMYKDGQLYRIYARGKGSIPAFSEDFAALIDGYLALYEVSREKTWLDKAMELAGRCMDLFFSQPKNIFEFSSREGEALIYQKADISDDVISSANSILCLALAKLGTLTDRQDLVETGEGLLKTAAQQTLGFPGWHSNWARAAQAEAIGQISISIPVSAAHMIPVISREIPSWALIKTDAALKNEQFVVCNGQTCLEPVAHVEQALEIVHDLMIE